MADNKRSFAVQLAEAAAADRSSSCSSLIVDFCGAESSSLDREDQLRPLVGQLGGEKRFPDKNLLNLVN